METASTSATSKMITGLRQLSQQGTVTATGQGALGKALLQTGQAAGVSTAQLKAFVQEQKEVEKASAKAAAATSGWLTSMKGLAAGFGLVVGVGAIGGFVKGLVEAGLAQERMTTTLKAATGSAVAAAEAYSFVRGVANGLGISLQESIKGFAALTSVTQGTALQGQATRDLFLSMSQAARVMGLSASEMGGVMSAITQIIGKNTVSMEELRQQLGDRLPAVLRLTAQEMGVTTAQMIDMVSKGQVLAQDFIPALTRALSRMGSEAPAAAASAQASLQRVGNAWFELKASIAQSGVLDAISAIAERTSSVLQAMGRLVRGSQNLQGVERVTQLNEQLVILGKQIAITEKDAQARIAGGMNEAAALSAVENVRRKYNEVADEITKIEGGLQKVRGEEEAISAQLKEGSAREAQLKFFSDQTKGFTALKAEIAAIDKQLSGLASKDVDILKAAGIGTPQELKVRTDELLKERQSLQDRLQGIDRKGAASAAKDAAQAAANRAKADEDQLQASLKRQEALIEQSFDERRKLIDQQASAALTADPRQVEQIETDRNKALRDLAVEQAQALEQIRLESLDKQLAAELRTLDLQIAAHKGQTDDIAKFQAAKVTATADTEAKRQEIVNKTGEAEIKSGKQTLQEQLKNAKDLVKLTAEAEQDRLKARIDVSDDQIALVNAQVDGEVLTIEQGAEKIRVIMDRRIEDTRQLYIAQADAAINGIAKEVRETELGQAQIVKIKAGLNDQLKSLDLRRATEEQEFLNKQVQAYERFVDKVSSGLASIFEGLLDGTLNLLDSFKKLFLRTLSQLVAEAATRVIIVPIVTTVLGAIGGGLGPAIGQAIGLAGAASGVGSGTGSTGSGSLLETGGTALAGVGLARNIYSMLGLDTLTRYIGTGLTTLKDTMLIGLKNLFQSSATQAAEQALLEASLVEQGSGITPAGQAAGFAGNVAGIAGGLAALGGGIYAALNASNIASKAAFAASAAAGAAAAATAAYGAVTGAALVTAGGTGWTGIGLIVAAVMAVIGVVLDRIIKPSGPTLSVGRPSGLGIGVEGDKLAVSGNLGAQVLRKEKIDPGLARSVQAQMEEGITAAVMSVVQTINAVALDPTKLLEPTQAALRDALASVKDLNSSNFDKMSSDITEQLRFINIQIVAGMLDPVNKAFDQLRDDGSLKEQIERLPGTTSGLVAVFKNMNQQLEEISKGENTDVLRQLSTVRNQVENFGNRIAGTAGQIAESIVNSIVESFDEKIDPSLAKQITQFSELMNDSLGALSSLRATQQTLEGAGLSGAGVGAQIDRLTQVVGENAARISTQIVTTALSDLATEVDQVIAQPLKVQATTVNALFTDSMAALNTLWAQWHALADAGIDTTIMQEQFTKLVGGILQSTTEVLDKAFETGSFSEFLNVLASIPPAVMALNPAFQKMQAIGAAFSQVVGPIAQSIAQLEDAMRSTAEKVTFTAGRITELRSAITDAGDSADKALPLYAQLAQAVIDNANVQIQQIQEIAQAWHAAMDQVTSDIKRLEDELGTFQPEAITIPRAPSPATQFIGIPEKRGSSGVIEDVVIVTTRLEKSVAMLTKTANEFNRAVMSGDTEAAIKAIQAYEQAIIEWADQAIKAIQAERQAAIDAQQAIIDGIQDQIDAQQKVIDSIQDEADAQQKVINATQKLIDVQQKVIDAIHDQMDAQQEVIDAIQDQIDAQQDVIDGTQKQMDAQQKVINGVQKQIDAVNDAVRVQQKYIDSLQKEVKVRQDAVDSLVREIASLRQLRDRVADITRAGLSPARQAPAIREEMAATRARLMTSGGDDAIKELEKLISLNEELKQLGEQTDQLILIKEALDNLNILQAELTAQLGAKEGELPIAQQQLDAANAAVAAANLQLDALNAQLDALNAQMEFEKAQLDTLNAQLEFERAQLDALMEQKKAQEDVLKAIADQLKPAEAQLKALNAQLEFERAQLDAINARKEIEQGTLNTLTDQLKEQQDILAEIEKSTYWDKQIATIQTIALNELNNIKKWLAGVEGPTSWEDQIKQIQNDSLAQLRQIESDLKFLFLKTVDNTDAAGLSVGLQQRMVGALDLLTNYNLRLPIPIEVKNFYEAPRQRGGLVGLASGLHYAQGGMVPTLLEPGERVFTGPMSHAQQGALMAVNQAWPRFANGGFTVPGSGVGDSVHAMLPQGSFVLNKRASGNMGFQDGGPVPGGSAGNGGNGKTEIHHHHHTTNISGNTFSDHEDLKRLEQMLERIRRKRGDSRM